MLEFTKPVKEDYLYIRLNNVYQSARRRCTDPKHHAFTYYGAKGVTIEWESLQEFLDDVDRIDGWDLKKFLNKELQLDKDLKGGRCYSVTNCTWLSPKENRQLEHKQANFRKVLAESPTGELFRVTAVKPFCREHHIPSTAVFKMLRGKQGVVKGWLFWYETEDKPPRPTVYKVVRPDSSYFLFDNYQELGKYGINEARIRECIQQKRSCTKEGLTASIVKDRNIIDNYWFTKNKQDTNRNV